MTNILGNYNPSFFANEALDQLFGSLGMAGRVYRDYDDERASTGNSRGDVINIRRPGKFTAQTHVAGTGTTAQAVEGQNVQITLDNHQEVKFELTDKELAYSGERIINEHIKPAAFALADKIDQDLHALGAKVGAKHVLTGSVTGRFITGPRKVLRAAGVPMNDGNIHYAVDTGMEEELLNLNIFHQASTTGEGNNGEALMRGSLGERFGVETFVSQNADVAVSAIGSTATASDASGDEVGAVVADTDVNTGTLAIDGLTDTQTVGVGDTFTIAGDSTKYIVTAGGTVASNAVTVSMYPALRKSAAEDAVVTFDNLTATEEAAHLRNLMFHTNAFALGFAPLPRTGDGRGAEIEVASDPFTGLSLRARMWYDGGLAKNMIALDALYGAQALDGNMAVRALRAPTIAPVE